ncbi:MAG: Gldg family protein [Sandaracinus sp.]
MADNRNKKSASSSSARVAPPPPAASAFAPETAAVGRGVGTALGLVGALLLIYQGFEQMSGRDTFHGAWAAIPVVTAVLGFALVFLFRMPAGSISAEARRQQNESLGFLGIVGGVLIALNVIGFFAFTRIDGTSNHAYSLSPASRNVVSNLDETLTITAYFTSDLPAPFNATEQYVRNLLAEYQAAAPSGRVAIRFVSPDTDEEREEADHAGVHPVQHQHIENDAVSVVEGYRGLVFEYLGNHQALPVIQPDTEGLEYSITVAIMQLTGEELEIGVLSGHEGPQLTKGLSTWQRMLPTYHVTEVSATSAIDEDLRALIIVDPQTELTEDELHNIDAFVMSGHGLGIFGGSMEVDLQAGPDLTATPTHSGLNGLLGHWGITLGENIVADAQCGRVPMRTPYGIQIPVLYPPAPIVTFTDDEREHPVLFHLQQTPLFFASAIETTDAFRNAGGSVLMRSSEENSWLLEGSSVSLRIREPAEWRSTMGGESGPFPLAVALDGEIPSAYTEGTHAPEGTHVLVVGTSTVIRDEFLPQEGQMSDADLAGAMAFALNAVDWLAQDHGLIEIRAKSIEEPALEVPQSVQQATAEAIEHAEAGDETETQAAIERRNAALEEWEGRKARYRWGNTLLIPLLFAAFGVGRWWFRASKRATLRA